MMFDSRAGCARVDGATDGVGWSDGCDLDGVTGTDHCQSQRRPAAAQYRTILYRRFFCE